MGGIKSTSILNVCPFLPIRPEFADCLSVFASSRCAYCGRIGRVGLGRHVQFRHQESYRGASMVLTAAQAIARVLLQLRAFKSMRLPVDRSGLISGQHLYIPGHTLRDLQLVLGIFKPSPFLFYRKERGPGRLMSKPPQSGEHF